MNTTKHCKRCDRTLPIERFSKDKKLKDGYAFYCKDCMSTYGKKYRQSPQGIYNALKSGDRFYKNIEMGLSKEGFLDWYINEQKTCAYCSIPEEKLHLLGSYYKEKCGRLTIDRVDNEVGYDEGNLVLSCYRCNFIKADIFSYEEMLEIGRKYLRSKWEGSITE